MNCGPRRWSLRAVAGATAAALACLGLAACTGGGASSDNPNQPSAVTMFGAANPPVRNMDTDWTTQFVEKKFHLKITWHLSAAAGTAQPMLFSSGNYPDVALEVTLPQGMRDGLPPGRSHCGWSKRREPLRGLRYL